MGFMVQCEECEVWQHGICMGIELEEDCPEKYYCELCRPDLHPISPYVTSHHRHPLPASYSRTTNSS
ncbi:hypothetical protein DL93DRAFT_2073355 [Clavulina sp. PMI_390]|nr:hypothetical protein DL93DRAFT_2073355 [Clavulina sp. PMI_390]